jgi:hypothetical protein
MQGLQVFRSLTEALREGYQVDHLTREGYVVRTRTPRGWTMALVAVSASSSA